VPRSRAAKPLRHAAPLLILLALAGGRAAAAEDGRTAATPCAPGVVEWLDRCGRARQLSIVPRFCPVGLAIIDVTDPATGGSVRVEISHDGRPAFRRTGALGLSPVANAPDWSQVDAATRGAFEAFAACAESAADATVFAALDHPTPPPASPVRIAWRVLLALAFFLVAWRISHASTPIAGNLGGAWSPVVLTFATFLIRCVLLEPAFFHQSGHGPGWLESARRSGPPHGPGYAEVFGWVVYVWPQHQEAAVFFANAAIGALLPWLFLIISRNAGASGWVPWAVAGVVAVDPLLARISLSESYFNVAATLLAGAAALLGWACGLSRPPAARAATVIAAGLLVSQAARLHPNTWPPAALLPLVILLGAGRWRDRIAQAVYAAAGVFLVVAISTGADLLAVLRAPFGQQWTPALDHPVAGIAVVWAAAGLAALSAVLALVLSSRRQVCAAVAVGGTTLAAFLFMRQLAVAANLLVYQLATLLLYAPVLVAAAASAVAAGRLRANCVAAFALLSIGIATLPWRWTAMTRLPTDALEQRLFVQWRKALPTAAHVWFLSYSDMENLRLPLWASDSSRAPFAVGHELRLDETPQPPQALIDQGLAYYYHSSICSRPDGRKWCAAVESRLDLEPVERRDLPAVVSLGPPFDAPRLEVVLYRVRGFKP
jgi:hypothetical protein